MTEGLHPRRLRILKFLARREDEEPPSVADVAGAVGLRSTQTAHHHLVRLEAEGYVKRLEAPSSKPSRKRRPIRLTEKGWEAVGTVPLLGRIAAGRGMEAVENEEAYSLVSRVLAPRPGRRRFLLEARGQSMTGAGIEDGDILVIEEDPSPPDGTVVAALLRNGEETTVKTLYRENGNVRLRAENGDHQDIVVDAAEVAVQGRLVWVLHPARTKRRTRPGNRG